jgi:hypothetical protein
MLQCKSIAANWPTDMKPMITKCGMFHFLHIAFCGTMHTSILCWSVQLARSHIPYCMFGFVEEKLCRSQKKMFFLNLIFTSMRIFQFPWLKYNLLSITEVALALAPNSSMILNKPRLPPLMLAFQPVSQQCTSAIRPDMNIPRSLPGVKERSLDAT